MRNRWAQALPHSLKLEEEEEGYGEGTDKKGKKKTSDVKSNDKGKQEKGKKVSSTIYFDILLNCGMRTGG
jgi:hypothetical protein